MDWEPPLFVVGQVRSSAHVTEGNSVLVGHVRGAAGYNVFDHLDKLVLGDTVVANSRGETYDFVVTDIQVLPKEDTSPTLPTDSPRLTLMTCSGEFNPLTGEYPDRLWVIAEPVDVVAARSTTSSQPTPTASVQIAPPRRTRQHRHRPRARLQRTGGRIAYEVGRVSTRRRRAPGAPRRSAERAAAARGCRRRACESGRPAEPRRSQTTRTRTLLPMDAHPRAAAPDGSQLFVVEYFTSAALAQVLPAASPTSPGDMIVVYRRQADGRVTDILLGAGNDPAALLALLN